MTYQEYAPFSPEVCGCSDPPQEEHIHFLKHCATLVILVIELSHSAPATWCPSHSSHGRAPSKSTSSSEHFELRNPLRHFVLPTGPSLCSSLLCHLTLLWFFFRHTQPPTFSLSDLVQTPIFKCYSHSIPQILIPSTNLRSPWSLLSNGRVPQTQHYLKLNVSSFSDTCCILFSHFVAWLSTQMAQPGHVNLDTSLLLPSASLHLISH